MRANVSYAGDTRI